MGIADAAASFHRADGGQDMPGTGDTSDYSPDQNGIDAIVYAFEKAHRAGTNPRIEEFLEGVGPRRLELLVELILSDLELRLRGGRDASLDHYLGRFPELAGAPNQLAAILGEEVRLRQQAGRAVDPEEYQARLGPLGIDVQEVFRRVGERRPEIPGYEVLGEIARGGMGVVYRARQEALQRVVALKLIRGDRLTADSLGDRYRARFRREAEAVAALNHPNIVQVYEGGERDGGLFLAMELVEGPSLQKRLDSEGVLDPGAAAELVERAARAVEAVHQRGIVHRDLKPDNILLAPNGEPKVADFGLARPAQVADGQTRQGTVVGTPEYMSPEQAALSGDEPTAAVDVYGLGAILHACLTGHPPFARGPVLATLERVRSQAVVPLRTLRPDCPRDLETIALKCLEKEPGDRYASAADLADDLSRWRHGRPITARRAGTAERAWKWSRRNPLVASLGLATVVALAIGVGLGVRALRERIAHELTARTAQAQARRSRRMFELGRIRQSLESWETGDLRTARRRLEEVSSDLRGWEWRHLDHLYRPDPGRVLTADPRLAGFFEFVGKGDRYILPIDSRTLVLRDADTGAEVRRFTLDREIAAIALDERGERLAAADEGGRLVLWDPRSGSVLSDFPGGGPARPGRIVFSTDGSRLAILDSPPVSGRVVDLPSGRHFPVGLGDGPRLQGLAFDPELRLAATIAPGDGQGAATLSVRDLDRGAVVWTRPGRSLLEPSLWFGGGASRCLPDGAAEPLRFLRAGSLLLARIPLYRGPQLFDARTGEPGPAPERVVRGLISPDDRLVLAPTVKNDSLEVSELATGRLIASFGMGSNPGASWRFGPREDQLCSWSSGNVTFWDLLRSRPLAHHQGNSRVNLLDEHSRVPSLAFSPDGTRYAIRNGEATLTVREYPSGRSIRTLARLEESRGGKTMTRPPRDGFHGPVRFSPDGRRLVAGPFEEAGGEPLILWDLGQPPEPLVVADARIPTYDEAFFAFDQSEIAADARRVVVRERAPKGFRVRSIDLESDLETVATVFEDERDIVAWSFPNPAKALLGKLDGSVAIREAGRPSESWRAHDGPVDLIAGLPAGDLVATVSITKRERARTGDPARDRIPPADDRPEVPTPARGAAPNERTPVGLLTNGRDLFAPLPEIDPVESIGETPPPFLRWPGYADRPQTRSPFAAAIDPAESSPSGGNPSGGRDAAVSADPESNGHDADGLEESAMPDVIPSDPVDPPVVEQTFRWAVWGRDRTRPLASGAVRAVGKTDVQVRILDGGRRLLLVATAGGYVGSGERVDGSDVWIFDLADGGRIVHERRFPWSPDFGADTVRSSSLAVSDDGRLMALGRSDGTVQVLDTATGQERIAVSAHSRWVAAMAFDPAGERLVTAGGEGAVKLWDVETGVEVLALQRQGEPRLDLLRFAADGTRLLGLAHYSQATIWHATARR